MQWIVYHRDQPGVRVQVHAPTREIALVRGAGLLGLPDWDALGAQVELDALPVAA